MEVSVETGEVKVRVSVQRVIDQLHGKYGKQVAMLVQENAEAQAAIDELTGQVAELQSELAALRIA